MKRRTMQRALLGALGACVVRAAVPKTTTISPYEFCTVVNEEFGSESVESVSVDIEIQDMDDVTTEGMFVYLDVKHDYLWDVSVSLEHAHHPSVQIMSKDCEWNPDLHAYWYDSAPGTLEDEGCSDYQHTYERLYHAKPKEALSALDGLSKDGVWTLVVTDTYPLFDSGKVKEVCIGWLPSALPKYRSRDCSHVVHNGHIHALNKCQKQARADEFFKYVCTGLLPDFEIEEVDLQFYDSLADCLSDESPTLYHNESLRVDSHGVSSLKCHSELGSECDSAFYGYASESCTEATTSEALVIRAFATGICVNESDSDGSYVYECDANTGALSMRRWLVADCVSTGTSAMSRLHLDDGCVNNHTHDAADASWLSADPLFVDFNCTKAAAQLFASTQAPTTTTPPLGPCAYVQTSKMGMDPNWPVPVGVCFFSAHYEAFVRFKCAPPCDEFWCQFHDPYFEVLLFGHYDYACEGSFVTLESDLPQEMVCDSARECPHMAAIVATAQGYTEQCPADGSDEQLFGALRFARLTADDYREQPIALDTCFWNYSAGTGDSKAWLNADGNTLKYSSRVDGKCPEAWDSTTGDRIHSHCDAHRFVQVFNASRRLGEGLQVVYSQCVSVVDGAIGSEGMTALEVDIDVEQFPNSDKLLDLFLYIDIEHTHLSDLFVRVAHYKTGKQSTAMKHECAASKDLRVYFSDHAPGSLEAQQCWHDDFHSDYRVYNATPENAFSMFDAVAKANLWRVYFQDTAAGDGGLLNEVCIGWLKPGHDFEPIPTTPPEPNVVDNDYGFADYYKVVSAKCEWTPVAYGSYDSSFQLEASGGNRRLCDSCQLVFTAQISSVDIVGSAQPLDLDSGLNLTLIRHLLDAVSYEGPNGDTVTSDRLQAAIMRPTDCASEHYLNALNKFKYYFLDDATRNDACPKDGGRNCAASHFWQMAYSSGYRLDKGFLDLSHLVRDGKYDGEFRAHVKFQPQVYTTFHMRWCVAVVNTSKANAQIEVCEAQTTESPNKGSNDEMNAGTIVGIVIGALLALALVCAGIVYVTKYLVSWHKGNGGGMISPMGWPMGAGAKEEVAEDSFGEEVEDVTDMTDMHATDLATGKITPPPAAVSIVELADAFDGPASMPSVSADGDLGTTAAET